MRNENGRKIFLKAPHIATTLPIVYTCTVAVRRRSVVTSVVEVVPRIDERQSNTFVWTLEFFKS